MKDLLLAGRDLSREKFIDATIIGRDGKFLR